MTDFSDLVEEANKLVKVVDNSWLLLYFSLRLSIRRWKWI
jgi:hypothetical protein